MTSHPTVEALAADLLASAQKLRTLDPGAAYGYALLARAVRGAPNLTVASHRALVAHRRASRLHQYYLRNPESTAWQWSGAAYTIAAFLPTLRTLNRLNLDLKPE